jgi:hypothetical protein
MSNIHNFGMYDVMVLRNFEGAVILFSLEMELDNE